MPSECSSVVGSETQGEGRFGGQILAIISLQFHVDEKISKQYKSKKEYIREYLMHVSIGTRTKQICVYCKSILLFIFLFSQF